MPKHTLQKLIEDAGYIPRLYVNDFERLTGCLGVDIVVSPFKFIADLIPRAVQVDSWSGDNLGTQTLSRELPNMVYEHIVVYFPDIEYSDE